MVSTATEWKNAAIQCDASGIPPPTITWEREGGVTPPTSATVTTSSDTLNRVHMMIIEYAIYNIAAVLIYTVAAFITMRYIL